MSISRDTCLTINVVNCKTSKSGTFNPNPYYHFITSIIDNKPGANQYVNKHDEFYVFFLLYMF